jgi:hypothetical protein
MDEHRRWRIWFGVGLVALSLVLFVLHYYVFQDLHHLGIFTLHDLAFLPIEVLIVTMVIHELLEYREKRNMLEKLNMVIGAFFSEVGTELLERMTEFDPDREEVSRDLIPTAEWTDADYTRATKRAVASAANMDAKLGDIVGLTDFLVSKRDFFLRLLENPMVLEHDQFTDLLWAVFHLTEELSHREDLSTLSDHDLEHLSGDLRRAYGLLTAQWLSYLKHLKNSYPYLYSLAVRTNPLDPNARAEVAA